MAIITVDKDLFEYNLVRSLYKFFNENTETNYNGDVFNTIYKTGISRKKEDILEDLENFKGVVSIEMSDDVIEHAQSAMNGFYCDWDADNVRYAKGNLYLSELRLRLITDTDETSKNKLGKVDLMKLKGMIAKIMNDNVRIPIYDFTNSPETITDLEFVNRVSQREYTTIPKPFNELQEGVYQIPFYVRVLEVEEFERVKTIIETLDRQF